MGKGFGLTIFDLYIEFLWKEKQILDKFWKVDGS